MDLLDALVAQLVATGGEVFEHTRLTDLQHRADRSIVTTERARITADRVVLATGQPVLRRHGFFARLHPQRSYAAALRSPWVPNGMYLSADQPTRSLRSHPLPGGEELLLVGGYGHVTGRGSETMHLEEMLAWARGTFGGEVTHTWSAQDHGSVTGLPYVGPMLPGQHHAWVATGFDKWGLAAAPAAALLLTKTMLADDGAGERPHWHRAFSTWSPREAIGVTRAARYNLGVGAALAKDAVQRQWREAAQAEPALSGVCTHLGGAVRWNDAERSWDCPLHGSRFDEDGSVLEGPAVCGLRKIQDTERR
jgi:glycine/D-amino acid oxidase-like deaminating enzyme/nitrite reductase/ring-hydroxylating ferredoxin subunit